MLKLDDFTLHKSILEIRYKDAHLLWDRAGEFWHQISEKWGELTVDDIKPNTQTFHIGRNYQLSVKLNKAHVLSYFPNRNLEDFQAICSDFMKLATELLQIETFTRIGIRLIFHQEFEDKKSASDALISTGIMKIPSGKHLNIQGKVLLPELAYRWEEDKLGALIKLSAIEEAYGLEFPPELKDREPIKEDTSKVVFDLDYYTLGDTAVGSFKVSDWIEKIRRAVNRDADGLMSGDAHE